MPVSPRNRMATCVTMARGPRARFPARHTTPCCTSLNGSHGRSVDSLFSRLSDTMFIHFDGAGGVSADS